jgi:hypothetical protein
VDRAEPRDAAGGVITFDDQVANKDGQLCLRYSPKYLLKRKP